MVESGFPNFVSTSWTGLLAPAHTPRPIVARLNAAINDALKTPELRIALERLSNQPLGGTPADFTAVIKADLDKWSPIVNALGLNNQ
jgi:tripartite-type tricarboxylate transporter receptor subunit TctC